MGKDLVMYVVLDHPLDFPDQCVAREWSIGPLGNTVPGEIVASGPDVKSVREQLPAGLHRIPRERLDDPVIVESWI